MATSGSFNTAKASSIASDYPKYCKVSWSASYESPSSTYPTGLWTVSWNATAQGGSTSGKYISMYNRSTTVTVSTGTAVSGTGTTSASSAMTVYNNTVVQSGTLKLSPSSTGAAVFNIAGAYRFYSSSSASGYQSTGNADGTLDTVALKADLSLGSTSMTITSSSTAALTYSFKSNSSYYYKLAWTVTPTSGSATSGTITIGNVGAGTTKTGNVRTKAELLSAIPSASTGTVSCTLTTYSDSGYATSIGTSSASCSIAIDTSTIKPSISLGAIAVNSYTGSISGYLVAGYSTAKTTPTVSAGTSSSITKIVYTIKCGTLSTATKTVTSSFTSAVATSTLTSSTSNYTLSIQATATDARGGSTTSSAVTATVYGYTKPTISVQAYRTATDSSTTADSAGAYVYVKYSSTAGTTSAENSIQSTTGTKTIGSSSSSVSTNTWFSLAATSTATVTVTATDKVTSSSSAVSVSTAAYPLQLYDNGSGSVGIYGGGFATFATNVEADGYFKGKDAGTGYVGKIILVPRYAYSTLGLSSGNNVAFWSAWIKKMVELYPSVQQGLFEGLVAPVDGGIVIWYCANTSQLSSGLPQYSCGVYIPYNSKGATTYFGTSAYTAWFTAGTAVTNEAQTFAGAKTFTGNVSAASLSASGTVTASGTILGGCLDTINTTANGAQVRYRFSDLSRAIYGLQWMARDANYGGRFYFGQYGEDSSGTLLSYREQYRLPRVTQGLTSTPTYEILTTKDSVVSGQSVITGSSALSGVSGATLSSQTWRKYGGVVTGTMWFNAGTVAKNGEITGTIASGYRPTDRATGSGFYGQRAFVALIDSSGGIRIKNTSSSDATFTTDAPFAISVTYIVTA